jgi:CRISPR/Cas system CSM-associated protein Csm2 small subunit
MFEYKTEAQLQEMTDGQRDNYAKERRDYESKMTTDQIEKAVNAAKSDLETKISEKEIEISNLKETVRVQGEKLAETLTNQEQRKGKGIDEVFEEQYKANVTDYQGDNKVSAEGFKIDASKVSTDVMSVSTVSAANFPTAGSTGVLSSGLITHFAKLVGFFGVRTPMSMILDLVDVMPLNDGTLIAINETVVGDAAITTECRLKPIVKETFSEQTASAEPVAAQWLTSTRLRRFYANIANRFNQKFAELVNYKLPNEVLNAVKTGATAFTAVPELAIHATPNNYDVLGACVASLENLGYMPNGIILHPYAWRNMKQAKGTDGHYALANGGSISVLENGFDWGGTFIQVFKDRTIGVDEFVVGDLFNSVKVGVDSQLMYFETDGRTDADTSSTSGLARNIRTHVIEKFFAVLIPTATRTAIIKDTFANVKTLIDTTP